MCEQWIAFPSFQHPGVIKSVRCEVRNIFRIIMRELEKQTSIELHQWAEKRELSGADGGPMTITQIEVLKQILPPEVIEANDQIVIEGEYTEAEGGVPPSPIVQVTAILSDRFAHSMRRSFLRSERGYLQSLNPAAFRSRSVAGYIRPLIVPTPFRVPRNVASDRRTTGIRSRRYR